MEGPYTGDELDEITANRNMAAGFFVVVLLLATANVVMYLVRRLD